MEGNTILVKEVGGVETRSVLVCGVEEKEATTHIVTDKSAEREEADTTLQIENNTERTEDGKKENTNHDKASPKESVVLGNGTVETLSNVKSEDPDNQNVKKLKFFATFISLIKKNHIKEKVIFMVSVSSLIFLGYCVMCLQWLLPYFYTATAPPLLLYRLVTYWQNKWQLFMCDFCYFGNILCFVFLWGIPWQTEAFTVLYAFTTGPLPWATILYRNSLVFHSVDKLTSVYIHILPFSLGFSLRWYSKSMSSYWYTDFVDTYNEDIGYMFLWLIGIPYVLFLGHVFMYTLCAYVLCIPGEQYVDSIRYLSGSQNGCTSKVLGCMGPNHKTLMYNSMCVLYGFLSIFVLPLFYKYFILHCLLVVVVMLITIWNGASYYIDYFGPRAVKF